MGRLTFNGTPVSYVPFGFEFKLGLNEGSSATLSYIDRRFMGQIGLLTFTMYPYVDKQLLKDQGWTASAVFRYQYRDGSTELRPREVEETLLTQTLDALDEGVKREENEAMFVFEVDHTKRKRRNVKIVGQFDEGGYPVSFVVPGKLYEAMVEAQLIVKRKIEWAPGAATDKAKTTWAWGRYSDYLNYNWVDWVRLVREGKLVGYAWNPFGKLEILSEKNAKALKESASVWDRLLGLIWGK